MEFLVGRTDAANQSDPILTLHEEAERVPEHFRRAIYLHLVARVWEIVHG